MKCFMASTFATGILIMISSLLVPIERNTCMLHVEQVLEQLSDNGKYGTSEFRRNVGTGHPCGDVAHNGSIRSCKGYLFELE